MMIKEQMNIADFPALLAQNPMLPALPLSETYMMDCIAGMKEYPDKWFDLAVVDPPYGIGRFKEVGRDGKIARKEMKLRVNKLSTWDTKPSNLYWNEIFRVSKNQIVFGANNFEMPPSEYFLIWDKHQMMPNFAECEYAWVSMGLKKPAKIYKYSINKHNQDDKIHPTQKPICLYDWIFNHYAKKSDLILDTHLGSGSSRIAAHKNKLNFVGFEIDKEYFDKQEKRFANYVCQPRLF